MRLSNEQLARYREDGVLVLPGLFSAEEVAALRRPLLVDLRNVYDSGPIREAGFDYVSVGR